MLETLLYVAYFAIGAVLAAYVLFDQQRGAPDNGFLAMLMLFAWPIVLLVVAVLWPIGAAYEAISGRRAGPFLAGLMIFAFILVLVLNY